MLMSIHMLKLRIQFVKFMFNILFFHKLHNKNNCEIYLFDSKNKINYFSNQ